jgi:uncharacterized protein (DUF302 family)
VIGNIVEKHDTNAPFDVVIEKLEEAVKDNGFSIVGVHDLKSTYEKKHLDVDFDYKIVQICNAEKSHGVLTNMSHDLGIMMPKSIVVARKDGVTSLRFMKMKPWMVSLMFPDIDIAPMSKMVTNIMRKIVTQAIDKA